ncbi:dTDP-glucose 4,6-dehydratase [Gracilibacillus xinjiangensis]|uniref:dTDP-glucose 4,6-dehydratase n=1 Tax=Gracilibacillus xinjiangensis TaxID=1193282 RepID=A0ABV8WUV9_9BACI
MKILVTGGAGFIGGNFIQFILDKYPNYKIINIDKLTYAGELTKHNGIVNKSNYKFIKEDIVNKESILALFNKEKFDYVVHFAAESHVDNSIRDSDVFVQTNVVGTHVLLEASLLNNVQKFIHISTDEVYGDLDFDSEKLFTESTSLEPNSPYSASKASSDMLVRSYFKTYQLPIIITRCSNNYGPYQFPEKLIPKSILMALRNQEIPIYGKGVNIRDWLYVTDHCTAIDLIMHKGSNGEVYNIGGNNEKSNIEVVKSILDYLGASHNLISYVGDRKGHDKRYAVDSTKLKELGWQPKYNFESGLEQTIDWYLENKKWLEALL